MSTFCLSQFLGNASMSIASLENDNASGHGKRQADERRAQRLESRNKSQLYMCRQPRRSCDDDDTSSCSSSSASESQSCQSPTPTTHKMCVVRCYSPTSIAEYTISPRLGTPIKTKFASAQASRRNAPKPVRQNSCSDLQAMTVVDAGVASFYSKKDSQPRECRAAETSCSLVDILSTPEL